jgi:hypothetical protein
MKSNVVSLILARQVVCKACSTDGGSVCLLQLRNEKTPPDELAAEHHWNADAKSAVGEIAWEDQVMRSEDAPFGQPPTAPLWKEYPQKLVDLLDTLVVTRWNAAKKEVQSRGLSSPVPGLYKKFDCIRHESVRKTSKRCRTLLVENNRNIMKKCMDEIADGTLDVTSGVFVAFLGTDHFLSDRGLLTLVKQIGEPFERIYYESYDVMDDKVDVLPIGLSEYYLRFQDWDVISDLAQPSSVPETSSTFVLPKEGMVLGAFGVFYEVKNPSRHSAAELCETAKDESWLTCQEVKKKHWWSTLRSFRFMLNPTGNGAQSSKFYEALLARTVPICTKDPAFVKLHEKGWPIVLVDSYSDVEHMNLSEIYEQLAPRLEKIQPYLHLDAYWRYLHTGILNF